MNIPQPFQYQGSKRNLSSFILKYLPAKMNRLVEPFAGSAALSLACAAHGRSTGYWLNDLNRPLSDLLSMIVNRPEAVADAYASLWRDRDEQHLAQFYAVRDKFNQSDDPVLLLYLLARCVKGAVRYNSDGLFNQSPDKRRLGTNPARMRQNLTAVSMLLRGKAVFTAQDYPEVVAAVRTDDTVYMDPPYQGICNTRDHRYAAAIDFEQFAAGLETLNRKKVRYLVSYDGRQGEKSYGRMLPAELDLVRVELEAGRSSQATLLGKEAITVESLYLSRPLAEEIGTHQAYISQNPKTNFTAETQRTQRSSPRPLRLCGEFG